eukprot:SAG31_NODE_3169_length_4591_cov_7.118655_1_plen_211_part_00
MPPPAAAARDGAPSLQRQRLLLLGLVLSSRAEQLPLGTVNPSPCLSCKGGYDFFDFGHSDCTGSCNNASSTSIPIDLCQFHGCCFNDSVPSTAACFERELGDEAQYVIDSKDVITLLVSGCLVWYFLLRAHGAMLISLPLRVAPCNDVRARMARPPRSTRHGCGKACWETTTITAGKCGMITSKRRWRPTRCMMRLRMRQRCAIGRIVGC